jgi:hypothetical protein
MTINRIEAALEKVPLPGKGVVPLVLAGRNVRILREEGARVLVGGGGLPMMSVPPGSALSAAMASLATRASSSLHGCLVPVGGSALR